MRKALVLLSGGQDSATCMAWAAVMFDTLYTISFDYGQRHKKELEAARKIASLFKTPYENITLPILKGGNKSALTNPELSVLSTDPISSLPLSFLPGRNIVFLSLASAYALNRDIYNIVTGVCQTDYAGYPDCRRDTINSLEQSIRLGNKGYLKNREDFHIHTPLMYLTKTESIYLAQRLPHGMEAVSLSWTCHKGEDVPCGICDPCKLRLAGFDEARIGDPAFERLKIQKPLLRKSKNNLY